MAVLAPAAAAAAASLTPLSGGRGALFAGSLGFQGFAGDGGAATDAQLSNPIGLAVDAHGNLLVADALNSRVRRISTTGAHVIRTLAGNGTVSFATENAPAVSSPLPHATDVAVGPHGDIYISTGFARGFNGPVYRLDPAGRIHRFAGLASGLGGYSGDGGPATAAQIDNPTGVAADAAGNVYIAEGVRIRKVNPAGIISTYAGGATGGFSGDGGPAKLAKLEGPRAVTTDAHGNVYLADGDRVRKVTPAGIITTIAGTGTGGFSGDGRRATAARLFFPEALAVDGAGDVYISDQSGEAVRAVNAAGVISTLAGSPHPDGLDLYGPITKARLSVFGLAVDQRGDLFMSDTPNEIIRELQPPLRGAAAASCTKAAAQQLVERQHLGGFTGFNPHPVAKVLCGPFLGPHSHAMVVALTTEICTSAGGWVVYRRRGRTWHRVLFNPIGAVLRRGRTRFTQNIAHPRPTETFCTTRRWLSRTWHWNGRRLVHGRYHVIRRPNF